MNYDISTDEGMANSMAWVQDLIDNLKDGGSWAIPRTLAIYTFDKVNRIARFTGGRDPETERVLGHMGWQIQENV